MFGIEDSDLPGLADLSESRLRAMTGAEEVDLLRLRYRPGKRAILHVATRSGADRREGALWFFKGQKGQRLAHRASGRCVSIRRRGRCSRHSPGTTGCRRSATFLPATTRFSPI